MSRVDRSQVTIIRQDKLRAETCPRLTGGDALAFMWELTREVYGIMGKHDVESRLRRDIVNISRV